jgi:hypothetical protein
MKRSRRHALTAGVGALAGLGAGFALRRTERQPRAWRVAAVDCDEPVVDGYGGDGGDGVYGTLLTSRREARDRLRTTDCFDPYREEYFALDYDAYVVSVRLAALPAGTSIELTDYEFDGDTLWCSVEIVDEDGGNGTGDDAGSMTLRQVVTTWELHDAAKPARVELVVERH